MATSRIDPMLHTKKGLEKSAPCFKIVAAEAPCVGCGAMVAPTESGYCWQRCRPWEKPRGVVG